jgi:hypothetical protein
LSKEEGFHPQIVIVEARLVLRLGVQHSPRVIGQKFSPPGAEQGVELDVASPESFSQGYDWIMQQVEHFQQRVNQGAAPEEEALEDEDDDPDDGRTMRAFPKKRSPKRR